jgi:pimeloyl-ACP methyl ester carboxylesterase
MKLKVAGGELAYDVRGDGPPVVLLHAFPLGRRMWDAQVEALAPTHRVIRFDCRGFGDSPPGDGLLTMERIADDAAALLDHLGVGSAVLCGLSMGGYAAFAFVRRHAGRLRGLVLADTKAEADDEAARAGRAELAERVRREGTSPAEEAFVPRLVGATTLAERPDVVARVRELVRAASPRGIADALAGLAARADSTPTLREIRVPTLVICGDEDSVTPLAGAEALAGAIAGARLAVIPGAGHVSNLEAPAEFGSSLSGFLASLG